MKRRVYLETTIGSYLCARPARDLIMAAQQQALHEWWTNQRSHFDLFVSQFVVDEAAAGDLDAAQRRLGLIRGIPRLDITDSVRQIARALLRALPIPPRAQADALHIAAAAAHGIEYLLTWNCRHLANATWRPIIDAVCRDVGVTAPVICTPLELTEV